MTALLLTTAAIALGLAAAVARAPRDGFETGIFIAAPPERVWALLTDPAAHADDLPPRIRAIQKEILFL